MQSWNQWLACEYSIQLGSKLQNVGSLVGSLLPIKESKWGVTHFPSTASGAIPAHLHLYLWASRALGLGKYGELRTSLVLIKDLD